MAVIPLFESDESDEMELYDFESDESDEAARPRGRRFGGPIRTPGRGGNVPTRPQQGFATRTELMATAKRIDDKIATLSTGVKALDGRMRTLDTEQGKLRADLKKESDARRGLSSQISNVTQMSMLLPLLTTQKTVTMPTPPPAGFQAGDKVVIDSGDSFSRVLPILLMSGGLGGGGSSGGAQSSQGGMFGGDNSMMMIAMFMALGK
jgi:hypothetical protein